MDHRWVQAFSSSSCRRIFVLMMTISMLYIQTVSPQPQCYNCPFGTTAPVSSTSKAACQPCPDGSYLEEDSDICVACSRGSFSVAGTHGSCNPCPLGKTTIFGAPSSALNGDSACTSFCPGARQYTLVNGTCAACARGFYCGFGDVPMIQCPHGQTTQVGVAAQDVKDCTIACQIGYGVDISDGTCQPCPLGKYSPDATTDCTACDIGTTTYISGASTSKACLPCGPGTYLSSKVAGATGCIKCPKGKWSTADMADIDDCSGLCPPGKTTDPKKTAGAVTATECVVQCNLGQDVPSDITAANAGICTDCPPGKYEDSGNCLTCRECKSTSAGSVDPSECSGDAPTCSAGQGPDVLTYKCTTCPHGQYSMGGTGGLICGGSPTASPTVETVTYISVKHLYTFPAGGLIKYKSPAFTTGFKKAIATVFKLPDSAITKFDKPLKPTAARRHLLAGYSASLSYTIVAYNVDPKSLTSTLGNPATSTAISSTAKTLTGVDGAIGTITYLDTSPSAGPTMLPTPFSFFAQTTSTTAMNTWTLIALVLGLGVGCPVLGCLIYQCTLCVRLLRRPSPSMSKGAEIYDGPEIHDGRSDVDAEFARAGSNESVGDNDNWSSDDGSKEEARGTAAADTSWMHGLSSGLPSVQMPQLPFFSSVFGPSSTIAFEQSPVDYIPPKGTAAHVPY